MGTRARPVQQPSRRRVAVAIDDSEAALVALQNAVAVARRDRASLTIIAVAPGPWPTVALAGACPRRMADELIAATTRRAGRLAATLPPDVAATVLVRCGSPVREIVRVLREQRHDVLFLALGEHGRSIAALTRWSAYRLMRRAPTDVVILRPAASAPIRGGALASVPTGAVQASASLAVN